MKEIGRVIEKNGNKLIIELSPSSYCSSCKLCQRGNEDNFILEVLDKCSAKPGDFVSIEISKSSYYKATILIYIVPLIFFILGTIIGYIIGNYFKKDSQILGFVFGLLFLSLSYLVIRFIDRKIQKKSSDYIPVAKEIVDQTFITFKNNVYR
jgi:sigma-E factor negative regulatory protein RseC